MHRLLSALTVWIAALWWGSLTTTGFLVVPMLFASLPSKAMAGNMAAQLFSAQTWVAMVCGLLLLLQCRTEHESLATPRAATAMPSILAGMLLALISEFVVAPHIVARDHLPLWHSLGTAAYALQWLCAALVMRRWLRKEAG